MKLSRVLLGLLAGVLAAGGYMMVRLPADPQLETLHPAQAPKPKGNLARQDFDFYVLALSWSPSYCAIRGREADREQCGGKPRGFTVHGLWPQYERGYPENCAAGEPGGVSRDILRQIQAVMPSDGLARHQWRKHGTCSGLTQQSYFETIMKAHDTIRIPDVYRRTATERAVSPKQMEAAFLAANPGLTGDGLAVSCADGNLSEVRICLTKDLGFRACKQVDSNGCRAAMIDLPPMR